MPAASGSWCAATPAGDTPREYPATVVGTDADNDLALLKIDVQGVPFFDLNRDAAPRQGQLVLAYGSPMGLAQSASLGLVSALDRQLNTDDPRTYIQTDASMNPGNSGGPLVDLDGKLLGVNTMILSQSGGSEGLGFAVPLEVIRHSYATLRTGKSVVRPLPRHPTAQPHCRPDRRPRTEGAPGSPGGRCGAQRPGRDGGTAARRCPALVGC